MISDNIKELINIITESKSSKRRGYVVKNITDTKTGKSKMIQVRRGRYSMGMTKSGANALLKSRTPTSDNQLDIIDLPDSRGRTHPATFHHEVGHIMRNSPEKHSTIRDEKEAWQYVKQTKPEIYQQGLKDKIVQNGFGSYVDNERLTKDMSKYEKEITKVYTNDPIFSKLSINDSKNSKNIDIIDPNKKFKSQIHDAHYSTNRLERVNASNKTNLPDPKLRSAVANDIKIQRAIKKRQPYLNSLLPEYKISQHKSFREKVPQSNPELNKKGWYQLQKS